MLDRGERPKLAAVAEEAMVSRATAYRYFPSEEALFLETILHARRAERGGKSYPTTTPDDPIERAVLVQRYLIDYSAEHETEFRMFLRVTFDKWLAAEGKPEDQLRQRRRLEMFRPGLRAHARRGRPGESWPSSGSRCRSCPGSRRWWRFRTCALSSLEEGTDAVEWAARTLVRAVLEGRS